MEKVPKNTENKEERFNIAEPEKSTKNNHERQEKLKYNLLRHVLFPTGVKQIHKGPVLGGKFWSLKGVDDLPDKFMGPEDAPFYPFVEINLNELIQSGAHVWMNNAEDPSEWIEIKSLDDIPIFRADYEEIYDSSSGGVWRYFPFPPEFYVVGGPEDPPIVLRCTHCKKLFKGETRKKRYGDYSSGTPCSHCGKGEIKWSIRKK